MIVSRIIDREPNIQKISQDHSRSQSGYEDDCPKGAFKKTKTKQSSERTSSVRDGRLRILSPEVRQEMMQEKEKAQLKLFDYYIQKQMEECTFQPAVNKSQGSQRRNLQQFLDDQNSFEARKLYKTFKVNFVSYLR